MGFGFGEPAADLLGDFECVLVPDALHIEKDCGQVIEIGPQVDVLKSVHDRGDLTEPDVGPVGVSDHHDLLELLAPVGLSHAPEKNFSCLGFDRASREVERRASDRVGDILKGQSVAPKGFFGNLDGDFKGTRVVECDLGDARKQSEFIPRSLSQAGEGHLVRVSGEGNLHDGLANDEFRDRRPLGVLGESVDGIHTILDLDKGVVGIRPHDHLEADDTGTLYRNGLESVDSRNALYLFLDADAEGSLDFFGRSSGVLDGNPDDVHCDAGEFLLTNGREGHQAADHQDDHQEIGGHRVLDEPGNDTFQDSFLAWAMMGSTCIPSITTCRGEMQIRSPWARESRMSTSSRSMRMTSTSLR